LDVDVGCGQISGFANQTGGAMMYFGPSTLEELHMRMVFSAAEKAGWLEGGQKRLDFMGFGLVQGQDGFPARKEMERNGSILKKQRIQTHRIAGYFWQVLNRLRFISKVALI